MNGFEFVMWLLVIGIVVAMMLSDYLEGRDDDDE